MEVYESIDQFPMSELAKYSKKEIKHFKLHQDRNQLKEIVKLPSHHGDTRSQFYHCLRIAHEPVRRFRFPIL